MIHGIAARRGIQAIQLTYENRIQLTDLVGGRLRQHGEIDKATLSLNSFEFSLEFSRAGHGYVVRQNEWLILSPMGPVAIMDDDSFQTWFEIVAIEDALSASVTPQNDPQTS